MAQENKYSEQKGWKPEAEVDKKKGMPKEGTSVERKETDKCGTEHGCGKCSCCK